LQMGAESAGCSGDLDSWALHPAHHCQPFLRFGFGNFSKTQGGLDHHPAQPVAWRA